MDGLSRCCRLTLLLACLGFFCGPGSPVLAQENERIISYDSHIRVNADSSLTVSETIEVYASGYQIKRGIFRDFPTHYRDDMGNRKAVGFKLLSVTRDGQSEPYHLKYYSYGVRIYCGDEDVYLSPGTYVYEIRYQTDRQLFFNPDDDELYWNVTGNAWDFTIERATATVELPEPLPAESWVLLDAFTGARGSTDRNCRFEVTQSGAARYETTTALYPAQGLTLVARFPKGLVREPTAAQRAEWWRADHAVQLTAGVVAALIFVYFILAWLAAGVDPKAGPLYPRGAPPEGMSPAACRYLLRLGVDYKTMVAAILSLGSKGYLRISETSPGDYVVTREPDPQQPQAMSPDESEAFSALFASGDSVQIHQDNRTVLAACQQRLTKSLAFTYNRRAFFLNRPLSVLGAVLSVAGFLITVSTVQALERPWAVVSIFGLIVFLLTLNVGFVFLLPRYTHAGRRLRDEVEGFRMALRGVAVTDLDLTRDEDIEKFKGYLPFAVALEAQSDWSRRMDEIFAERREPYYRPHWYFPYYSRDRSCYDLSNSLASTFSASISSASTPPSSSSGGGGGSSGGGGGGGGGGGW